MANVPTNTLSDVNDAIRQHRLLVQSMMDELKDVSMALEYLGMQKPSDQLALIYRSLDVSSEHVVNTFSACLADILRSDGISFRETIEAAYSPVILAS